MSGTNLQVRMKRHPQGMVTPDDFDIAHADLPALKEGEALVRSSTCRSTRTCGRAWTRCARTSNR